jgi:hypothetical protein
MSSATLEMDCSVRALSVSAFAAKLVMDSLMGVLTATSAFADLAAFTSGDSGLATRGDGGTMPDAISECPDDDIDCHLLLSSTPWLRFNLPHHFSRAGHFLVYVTAPLPFKKAQCDV